MKLPIAGMAMSAALLVSSSLAVEAGGQPGMFAGYAQFCGVPIIVAPTPQRAVAWRDPRTGQPLIAVDPGVMGNWTASRVFAIAHECGHHMRGHTMPQGRWWRHMDFWATRAQELDADCWAAATLAAHGYWYLADLERAARDFAMEGPFMQGNYPSGRERAEVVARCARGF